MTRRRVGPEFFGLVRRAYGAGGRTVDIVDDNPDGLDDVGEGYEGPQDARWPVGEPNDVSQTLTFDHNDGRMPYHEGARQAAAGELRIPRLTDTQLGALEVYIFDPAHAEVGDVFPGRIEGRTLVVDGDPERAWELLMAAANSAGASQDRYFENALLAVLSKLSRLTRQQPS